MREWYVARTKPRREAQSSVVLAQRGLETYFPLIERRQSGDAGNREPLFPGYLFTRLDAATPEWVLARSSPGIAYFLGCGDRPTAVPEGIVKEIRERIRERHCAQRSAFRRGDRVRIAGGAFDGIEALFDGKLSPSGRSRVLVQMVGRLTPVSVDAAQLRPAPARWP